MGKNEDWQTKKPTLLLQTHVEYEGIIGQHFILDEKTYQEIQEDIGKGEGSSLKDIVLKRMEAIVSEVETKAPIAKIVGDM